MKLQTTVSTALIALMAASCGSTRSELRPVAQSAPPATSTTASNTVKPAPTTTPAAANTQRSLVAPGATGYVNSDVDDNGNLMLEVELQHLPPPGDLDPTLTTYVVWIRPTSGAGFQNLGQLVLDSNRRGSLTTSTPYSSVEVVVTAEASPTPAEPSRFTVLQGTASKQ